MSIKSCTVHADHQAQINNDEKIDGNKSPLTEEKQAFQIPNQTDNELSQIGKRVQQAFVGQSEAIKSFSDETITANEMNKGLLQMNVDLLQMNKRLQQLNIDLLQENVGLEQTNKDLQQTNETYNAKIKELEAYKQAATKIFKAYEKKAQDDAILCKNLKQTNKDLHDTNETYSAKIKELEAYKQAAMKQCQEYEITVQRMRSSAKT